MSERANSFLRVLAKFHKRVVNCSSGIYMPDTFEELTLTIFTLHFGLLTCSIVIGTISDTLMESRLSDRQVSCGRGVETSRASTRAHSKQVFEEAALFVVRVDGSCVVFGPLLFRQPMRTVTLQVVCLLFGTVVVRRLSNFM